LAIRQGIATGNNEKFLRFHWEIEKNSIYTGSNTKKFVFYSKGGPYNKWFGNIWLTIKFDDKAYNELSIQGNHLPSRQHYFQEGITYSSTSSKGPSFRYFAEFQLFDGKGSCVFRNEDSTSTLYYYIALLNSKLVTYIAQCLNSTVETTQGDLKRIPFVQPPQLLEDNI